MKSNNKITSVALLGTATIVGLIVLFRNEYIPNSTDGLFFIAIIGLVIYVFVKVKKEQKNRRAGLPIEDELSAKIKYKAGYYTFISSIYIWLGLLLFQNSFSQPDYLLGAGILVPIVLFLIVYNFLNKQGAL